MVCTDNFASLKHEQNGRKVKNIQTHLIDGHIIEESTEPFITEAHLALQRGRTSRQQKDFEEHSDSAVPRKALKRSLESTRLKASPNNLNHRRRSYNKSFASRRKLSRTFKVNKTPTNTNDEASSEMSIDLESLVNDSSAVNNQDHDDIRNVSEIVENQNSGLQETKNNFDSGSEVSTPAVQKQNILPSRISFKDNNDFSDDSNESGLSLESGDIGGDDSDFSSISESPLATIDKPLALWTVDDVHRHFSAMPSFKDYAKEIKLQEIDGEAADLLQIDHLLNSMNFPLGPSLKFFNEIQRLRKRGKDF